MTMSACVRLSDKQEARAWTYATNTRPISQVALIRPLIGGLRARTLVPL